MAQPSCGPRPERCPVRAPEAISARTLDDVVLPRRAEFERGAPGQRLLVEWVRRAATGVRLAGAGVALRAEHVLTPGQGEQVSLLGGNR